MFVNIITVIYDVILSYIKYDDEFEKQDAGTKEVKFSDGKTERRSTREATFSEGKTDAGSEETISDSETTQAYGDTELEAKSYRNWWGGKIIGDTKIR